MMEVVEMRMPWRQMIQFMMVVVLVEQTLEADVDEKRMMVVVVVVHNSYCS